MHLGERPSRLVPKCHPIVFIATAFVLEVVSTVTALRMLMLEVPSPAVNGESVELRCSFDLENDNLYSIKWYKNNTEFYRYVPKDWPPGQYLPIPGVRVDLAKSTQRSVYLKNVDLQTAGFYKCEISAESPSFKTVKEVKQMQVLVLPTEGPKITGGLPRYHVGDTVSLNCTSAMSKPAAVLRWYINEELVGSTDYEIEYSTTLHSNGLETSILLLRFVVKETHFRDGNMRLRCTATIAKMYKMSNEELFHGSRQQNSGLHISENVSPVRSSASAFPSPVRWMLFLLVTARLLRMLANASEMTPVRQRATHQISTILMDHQTLGRRSITTTAIPKPC